MSNPEDILTDAHANAIGRLVVSASKLDSVMSEVIGALSGMGILTVFITIHHQQFSSKIDSLKALIHTAFGDDEKISSLIKLVDRAKSIGDFRNSVVHAYWTVDEEGIAYAVRLHARGKLSRSKRPVDPAEIQACADEALALSQALIGWRDHFWQVSGNSPGHEK